MIDRLCIFAVLALLAKDGLVQIVDFPLKCADFVSHTRLYDA
jgi:hypothetical protein